MSMEEDDRVFESQLRKASLHLPSEQMDRRVEAVFAQYQVDDSRRRIWSRSLFHRVAIAAGILLGIGIGVRLSLPNAQRVAATLPAAPLHRTLSAIQFEQETSTVYDDGIVAGTDDAAYQQYRRRTVREIYYEDPRTHSKLQVTIPTEQILIQKMELF